MNDVEVSFPRAGNWMFVCFMEDGEPGNPDHFAIGMVKAFSVRWDGVGRPLLRAARRLR